LILVMPEDTPDMAYITDEALITNLTNQPDLPLHKDMVRCVRSGRAAGILGLEMARSLLYGQNADYVLVGGSDSYCTYQRLTGLDEDDRVLATDNMDGFAPGEGAGFMLLTRHPEHATVHKDHIIALCQPSSSQEPGHLGSEKPYQGEGLAAAFRQALADYAGDGIHSIYASMNGENFWSKEYGVAFMRNAPCWQENIKLEHPADCYGDLGSATAPVLIGLAAENLKQQPGVATHLVYSSSDGPWRAAVRVEKRPRAGN
jgi:3-oxoacyl-[acyl-carrier-protein] synthase-1